MKKLISTILLSLALSTTISLAQTPPPGTTTESKPKIVGFIYEKGCIHKEFDLFLFLDNGKILHFDENNAPPGGAQEINEKLLKGVQGLNRIFACGITA